MSNAQDQQQLATAVGRIKTLIQQKLDGIGLEHAPAYEACPLVDGLVAGFRLTAFERDLLLWCAGVELDSGLGDLTASLPGREGRRCPTFALALSVLPEAHWNALIPVAPLRYWRMVELGSGGLTQTDLRIDERMLHQLAGVPYIDTRLAGMVHLDQSDGPLTPSQQECVREVSDAWVAAANDRPVLQLVSKDRHAQQTIAAAVAHHHGYALHRIDTAQLPTSSGELEGLVRLWQRECVLGRHLLAIERKEQRGHDDHAASLIAFCDELDMPLFLLGSERIRGPRRTVLSFDVASPDRIERQLLWRDALGERADALNGTVERLADQFELTWPEIRAAATRTSAADEEALRLACSAQARPKLDDLAKRIITRATWDDLVLPEREKNTLRDVTIHLAHRSTVHGSWGFSANSGRGSAITALFAGPSGTGKTLAAEILARELGLDLFKIDLSQVVSKYIGESEKNLARIFDAAGAGGSILLFDEADALFGKRSEVKDSHDRYANIEVSYLLQRMEEYRGLAILTTNMKQAIDSAFMRRLTFVVNFRLPDRSQRAAIWARMFPKECPQEGIDHAKLAQLNIAGGNIRSIALSAAHYAAAERSPLGMQHLLRAARSEYDKLDKALPATEVIGWT